jgi:hypothetical protein
VAAGCLGFASAAGAEPPVPRYTPVEEAELGVALERVLDGLERRKAIIQLGQIIQRQREVGGWILDSGAHRPPPGARLYDPKLRADPAPPMRVGDCDTLAFRVEWQLYPKDELTIRIEAETGLAVPSEVLVLGVGGEEVTSSFFVVVANRVGTHKLKLRPADGPPVERTVEVMK